MFFLRREPIVRWGYFTKESLKQEGFTIVQEGQVKKPLEVTMEEVREKFGEDIIIKG